MNCLERYGLNVSPRPKEKLEFSLAEMDLGASEGSYSKIPWLLLSRLSIFTLLLVIVVLFFHVL